MSDSLTRSLDNVDAANASRLRTDGTPPRINRFSGTVLADVPVLLPADYVLGIDFQKHDFEKGIRSYLRGSLRETGGWWYFYLYGLATKTPVGTMGLLALSIATRFWKTWAVPWSAEAFVWLPPLTVLGFVSSQSGFTHHLRYIFPAIPFLCVAVGRLGLSFVARALWHRLAVLILLLYSLVSGALAFPHFLAYFNEFGGGVRGGHWHMVDSNFDWGQDLLRLKDWLAQKPQSKPLKLAFFHVLDPQWFGMHYELPPSGFYQTSSHANPSFLELEPGFYGVSANLMHGLSWMIYDGTGNIRPVGSREFLYFSRMEPSARAGASIFIYEIKEGYSYEMNDRTIR